MENGIEGIDSEDWKFNRLSILVIELWFTELCDSPMSNEIGTRGRAALDWLITSCMVFLYSLRIRRLCIKGNTAYLIPCPLVHKQGVCPSS